MYLHSSKTDWTKYAHNLLRNSQWRSFQFAKDLTNRKEEHCNFVFVLLALRPSPILLLLLKSLLPFHLTSA